VDVSKTGHHHQEDDMPSIAETTTGQPADHRVTIAQIGQGALMNLGARDYIHDDKNGYLHFRIGPGHIVRKAIIVLNALDLYDVEIGHMNRRTYEWIPDATATDIDAAQLAETLLRMHGEVS
jgi:hypothetical protein